MKVYTIIKHTSMRSTNKFVQQVEQLLNEKANEGYEIITVSFGLNMWAVPTAYITLAKEQ